jgi:hypothetical protein
LGLVPSEKAIRLFAARIIMSGEAHPKEALIRTVILHEQNGDSIRYTLSGHRFPVSLNTNERDLFVLQ